MMETIAGVDTGTLQSSKMLIQELKAGEFPMDRVPNTSEVYNGYLEYKDYLRFESRIGGRLFSVILNGLNG